MDGHTILLGKLARSA